MYRSTSVEILLWCIAAAPVLADVNWPQFRGASCGVAEDEVLPVSWSTTDNVIWKANILGRGWSCPIVWGNRVFLTTVASEGHVVPVKQRWDRRAVAKFAGKRSILRATATMIMDASYGDLVIRRNRLR